MPVDETIVRDIVRRVLRRTLGLPGVARTKRPIIGQTEIAQAAPGDTLNIPAEAIITPLARQVAQEKRVTIARAEEEASEWELGERVVAIGADHGGYPLKETLKTHLQRAGFPVLDCGTNSEESVDYPDTAYAVAEAVAHRRAWRGIIIDGAGIGSCMAANKVPGVRAAMCYDQATAVNSREHNNANVLTLGAGLIGINLAQQIADTWLATDFGGGRHGRRVDKIMAIERKFSRES